MMRRNGKKIVCIIGAVFTLIISTIIFAAYHNTIESFELKVQVSKEDPQPGDYVTVTATLRNRSFGLYHIGLYPSKIALTVHPVDQNVFYHLIRKKYWIVPFQTVTITQTVHLTNSGEYVVSAFCPIMIGDDHFVLSESVGLEV